MAIAEPGAKTPEDKPLDKTTEKASMVVSGGVTNDQERPPPTTDPTIPTEPVDIDTSQDRPPQTDKPTVPTDPVDFDTSQDRPPRTDAPATVVDTAQPDTPQILDTQSEKSKLIQAARDILKAPKTPSEADELMQVVVSQPTEVKEINGWPVTGEKDGVYKVDAGGGMMWFVWLDGKWVRSTAGGTSWNISSFTNKVGSYNKNADEYSDALDAYEKKVVALSSDGLTETEINKLTKEYDALIETNSELESDYKELNSLMTDAQGIVGAYDNILTAIGQGVSEKILFEAGYSIKDIRIAQSYLSAIKELEPYAEDITTYEPLSPAAKAMAAQGLSKAQIEAALGVEIEKEIKGITYSLVGAVQGGVKEEILEQLFEKSAIGEAKIMVAALTATKPYLDENGEYDILSAVNDGKVDRNHLSLLFGDAIIDAAEAIKPYIDTEGNADIDRAVLLGVSDEHLKLLFNDEDVIEAHGRVDPMLEEYPWLPILEGEGGKAFDEWFKNLPFAEQNTVAKQLVAYSLIEIVPAQVAVRLEQVKTSVKSVADKAPDFLQAPVQFLAGLAIGGLILAPAYMATFVGSGVGVVASKDPRGTASKVGQGVWDYFATIPAQISADPAFVSGELIGVFILGPIGVAKLIKVGAVRADPTYIPSNALLYEFHIGKLPIKKGQLAKALQAGLITEADVLRAVANAEAAFYRNPKVPAFAEIGKSGIKIVVHDTPTSKRFGGLWHGTDQKYAFQSKEFVVQGSRRAAEPAFFTSPYLPVSRMLKSRGEVGSQPAAILVYTKDGIKLYPSTIQNAQTVAGMRNAAFRYLSSGRAEAGAYGPAKTFKSGVYGELLELEAMSPYGTKFIRIKSLRSRILGVKAGDFITTVEGMVVPIFRFAEKGAKVPKITLVDLAAIRIESISFALQKLLGKKGFVVEGRVQLAKNIKAMAQTEVINKGLKLRGDKFNEHGYIETTATGGKHPKLGGLVRRRVSGVVVNRKGKILLVTDKVEPKGLYGLPGGRIDAFGKLGKTEGVPGISVEGAFHGQVKSEVGFGVKNSQMMPNYMGKANRHSLRGSYVVLADARLGRINRFKFQPKNRPELRDALWWDGKSEIGVTPATYDVLMGMLKAGRVKFNPLKLKISNLTPKELLKARDKGYTNKLIRWSKADKQVVAFNNAVTKVTKQKLARIIEPVKKEAEAAWKRDPERFEVPYRTRLVNAFRRFSRLPPLRERVEKQVRPQIRRNVELERSLARVRAERTRRASKRVTSRRTVAKSRARASGRTKVELRRGLTRTNRDIAPKRVVPPVRPEPPRPVRVKPRTIRVPSRRVPPPPKKGVRLPIIFKSDEEKRKLLKGAIAFRMGKVGKLDKWYVVTWPYKTAKDVTLYLTEDPPPGVRDVKDGLRSAYKSIQLITGKAPEYLTMDEGAMDIIVRSPSGKGSPSISFKPDPKGKTRSRIKLKKGRMKVIKGLSTTR